jgi:hypothetical protein
VLYLAHIRGWRVVAIRGYAKVIHGPPKDGLPDYLLFRGSKCFSLFISNDEKNSLVPSEEAWCQRMDGVFMTVHGWGKNDAQKAIDVLTDD